MKRIVIAVVLLALYNLLSSSIVFSQGSLTPPGAPARTMKTLQQVEPRIDLLNAPATAVDTNSTDYNFIINQPGSYYLSANLLVTKTNGIQINAEGVTLDLNGFEISRASGAGGAGVDILATGHRASVRNGSIKGFGYGIRTVASVTGYPRNCAFRDLAVSFCTNTGIFAGESAVLESCRAHDNSGFAGILAHTGSSLSNCTASNNSASNAIFANGGSSLNNCTAASNTGTYAFYIGTGSSLTNCSALSNQSSAGSSAAFRTEAGCTISHCTASYTANTTATATPTTGMGFDISANSIVENCNASSNKGDGIHILSETVARDNICSGNGSGAGNGAGIHAIAFGNRIEGNNLTGNDRGLDVDNIANIITRNTARGNTTNYDIVANNFFGAIVDRTSGVALPVTGNSAPTSIGTTDPWANIAY